MVTVTVVKLDATTFEVSVQDRTPTSHIVTATPEYAAKLTSGRVSTEHLIARSFEFLLECEPNTSILRRFELPVIGRYFPEYERVMSRMLDNA